MLNLFFVIILSYLVGSIPTSILISKLVRGIDIRNYGSGNAGGSNVFRVLGWKWGILTIILDALKGAIAVIVVARFYLDRFPFNNVTPFDDFTLVQIICGVAAVMGHVWTLFAGFKGGKGIATGLGVLIMIVTVDMALALGVFFLVVGLSRYISLGSLAAAVAVPLIMIIRENIFGVDIRGYHTILPFAILLALFVIYTHRANIGRLLEGSERKVSFSKKKSA
ncbi:MAG: acyl-phosphate glycerol 3-phosphate acyltransferase [Stygiobacter sp. RIFOXYC12_FULL_38_8]|nr:MAG: acyl-phosphate glycerol 3-phosphate acyltransferase [Stygiobacter sp. GWC2_38_9]OGU84788.1 MAG: acyl-phosphate glycerol 3-phosphate acyltransferase [Stygiobacter sp. RIFOXYA12_FULL_38_9]OGV08148.1 MAG: acyl-phosphate glycerol 3-phosphate acyltransferase [Stygiobacter sp. RIFOXYB2_FULL_37_11]OGV15664.1 MAG: acyl-phosphate glycerol 3-phosphate acyltransferase [Stygiobacter sp. RIFOXYC2_FULL_38_25]OGV26058.1 MAG: acyl-phosphate glycerol 3-phosphate acyltransferase [Stygiobacter sp. RIFOXYC